MGLNKSTWDKWNQSKDLPVSVLVGICNHFGIAMGNFIVSSDKVGTQLPEDFASCEEVQRFMPDLMGTYAMMCLGLGVREISKILGISIGKFYNQYKNATSKSTLRVREFIDHCNRLKVSPASFVVHSDIEKIEGYMHLDFTTPECAILMTRISELEGRLNSALNR